MCLYLDAQILNLAKESKSCTHGRQRIATQPKKGEILPKGSGGCVAVHSRKSVAAQVKLLHSQTFNDLQCSKACARLANTKRYLNATPQDFRTFIPNKLRSWPESRL